MPSSIVSAYSERCSGASASASSSVPLPGFERLLRQSVDEVEVHVVEAGRARRAIGIARVVGRMDAVERDEIFIVEGLYADGEAIEADIAQSGQVLRRQAARIRFERDLRVRADVERRPQAGEDLPHLIDGVEARRAASEEHGFDRPRGPTVFRQSVASFSSVSAYDGIMCS